MLSSCLPQRTLTHTTTTATALQVDSVSRIQASPSGFSLPDVGPEQQEPQPCGGARQYCCTDSQTYAASCTEEGLVCMEHGPDIVCEVPHCATPVAVEGRAGVFVCPSGSGGVMLVGTLVGAGG